MSAGIFSAKVISPIVSYFAASSGAGSPINTLAIALSEYIAEIIMPVAPKTQIVGEKFQRLVRTLSSPQKFANPGSPTPAKLAATKNAPKTGALR